MKNNFEEIIDRTKYGSVKWDSVKDINENSKELIVPLSVADMEFRSPVEIREGLRDLADFGMWGYSQPTEDYYKAIKRWFLKNHNWDLDEKWITPIVGVVQGIYSAVRAFTEEGDKILLQTPVYFPFYNAIRDNNRKIIENPLIYNGEGYEIDFKDLEEKLKSAKMMILCSPHNPTGRVWRREELLEIARLANKYNVLVLSDEIHCDFTFNNHKHTVFAKLMDDFSQNYIIATSASKTFSLAGLSLSNFIIPDKDINNKFREQARIDGCISGNIFGMKAMEIAYTKCDDWYLEVKDYIRGNHKYLEDFLSKNLPMVKLIEEQGTYLAWMDFSKFNMTFEELEEFMVKEAKLYLDEGYVFGEKARCFERINLACPRPVLEKALDRLLDAAKRKNII